MYRFTVSKILILMTALAYGQTEGHDHDLSLDDHKNHLGIAIGPVYVIGEKKFVPGVHIHYSYLFEINNTHLGTGLGFESIIDEHNHYTISINISYLPIHNLTLTVAPGVLFSKTSSKFATHFEASYEFIFNKFHIGPVAEYAYAMHDCHFMTGLHISYGF
ncbi:hypothetical protein ACFLU5_08055 [Bacteroidota bacterium]